MTTDLEKQIRDLQKELAEVQKERALLRLQPCRGDSEIREKDKKSYESPKLCFYLLGITLLIRFIFDTRGRG